MKTGVFWALVSMFFWASSFPIGRTLIANQMVDPITLGMLRFGAGALSMLIVGKFFKLKIFRFTLIDAIQMALLGLIGTSLMGFFLFTAQKTISSVNSSMIEALSPLLIFIIGAISTRKFSPVQAFGLLFGFLGCLMVLGVISFTGLHLNSYQFGDFLIVCSSLCWSLYTVWGKPVIRRVGAYLFTSWTMLFGAMWLAVFDYFNKDNFIFPHTAEAWSLIAFYAIFPTAVAFFAWNKAQNYISLALLSLSEYLTPFCTGLISFLFLNEAMSGTQIFGAIVICGAILIEPEVMNMVQAKLHSGNSIKETDKDLNAG